jgi:flagellin
MASVNTNVGAMQAVSAMRFTDNRIVSSAKQLETGFRVADVFDDASVFAVAQGIRSNVKAHASVQSSLQQGLGLVDVTLAAFNGISNLIGFLRSSLIKASDGSLNNSQLLTYKADAQALHQQIFDTSKVATYNGRNQTLTTSAAVDFVADVAGRTITVPAFSMNPDYDDLGTAIDAINDTTTAVAAYDLIQPLEDTVNSATAEFAAVRRQITLQIGFNDSVTDALRGGLGAMVDSDIGANAAALASLQVQKELSTSALSISGSRPITLLLLYR